MTWRSALYAVLLCCVIVALTTPAHAQLSSNWTGSWSAPPDQKGPVVSSATIRQVVRLTLGGDAVRVRLSNLYGTSALEIRSAHVALHGEASGIRPESDHALTFNGMSFATIGKGESVLSDPVSMQVSALQELVVSLYLPHHAGPSTLHGVGLATAYIQRGADATAAVSLPAAKTAQSRFFITDVEVATQPAGSAIAVLGASVEDGVDSTSDANLRWADVLAMRLQADPRVGGIAVLNEGIAGNRLLHDADDPFRGQNAVARLDRDVLSKPGLRWIILDMGVNDIGAASLLGTPAAKVSVDEIIAGLKIIVARAHYRNVRVIGMTLSPFADADFGPVPRPYHTPQGEIMRQAVNSWLRSARELDAVLDADHILRDPAQPDHLLPAFDSGDHLHPNDAGHKALADGVDLCWFAQGAGSAR